HARDRLAGHGRGRCRLAPADAAIVRGDPHEHVVRAVHLLTRHDDGLAHGNADGDRLDALDDEGHSFLMPACSMISLNCVISFITRSCASLLPLSGTWKPDFW